MGTRLSLRLLFVLVLVAGPALAQFSHAVQPQPGVERTLEVPFSYAHPDHGRFALHYELARPFEPGKPTVFVVADGQQFYVRPGLVRPLQDELFGPGFNVVGIYGRGTEEAVKQRLRGPNGVDWELAYEVLGSDAWVEDLESVRRELLGPSGRMLLYGRSGGGLLVHQYLAKHGDHVAGAFTQAAVNRFVDAEFGLSSDTFWDEIGRSDRTLQPMLLEALRRHPDQRDRILLLLQRQNFFVPVDQIAAERARLIRALHSWDQAELARRSKEYQVDSVLGALASDPAGAVRLFELFAPVLRAQSGSGQARVDPDLEVGRMFARPLLALLARGRIAPPAMDLSALHRVQAEVYLLAGRFDHTADYRSQIALASHYPRHRLLLLADGHDFLALGKTGLYPALVQAALASGIDGPARAGVERKLSTLVYREGEGDSARR